jgi:putative transposase
MVIRDRDAKFTRAFDTILHGNGAAPKKPPPCSPNLNAFAERFVQTLRHECLNHFIVLGDPPKISRPRLRPWWRRARSGR